MKKTTRLRLSILVPLAAIAFAPAASAQRPLVRVAPPIDSPKQDETFDEREWSAKLRSSELAERRAAYDALLARALRSPDVRAAVKRWAGDERDLELAWTAELLLRELDQAQAQARPHSPFARLRRQLDDSFGGMDLGAPLGGDLGALFDSLHSGLLRGGPTSSHGTSVQIGPDGVHVEVRTEVDGEEHVETFDAESIEALLEAHPELEEKIGTQLSPGPLGRAPLFGGLDEPFFGRLRAPNAGPQTLAPVPFGGPSDTEGWMPGRTRTDVLGVRVRTPEDRPAPIDGIADDVGLEVVQVLPHTIAAALKLAPGDVILSIDGRDARSVDDVRAALQVRGEDDAVTVEIQTRGGERSTRSWEPEGKESVLF